MVMVGSIKQFKFVMPSVNSAWDKMKANREKLGASMSATQSTLAAISNSFAQVQADQISGMANLSAQAALSRINAERKAKSVAMLKQIDGAQASIDQAKIAAAKRDYGGDSDKVADSQATRAHGNDFTIRCQAAQAQQNAYQHRHGNGDIQKVWQREEKNLRNTV